MERALGDVLPTEADGDGVFARLGGRVVDVEGPVEVLYHVHVQFHPIGGLHLTGHLALASGLGVHCDDRVLGSLELLKIRC